VIDYVGQVAAALRVTTIRADGRFTWFGCASPAPTTQRTDGQHPAGARAQLTQALQRQLYRAFYITGAVTPLPFRSVGGSSDEGDPAFVRALAKANTGSGTVDPSWTGATSPGASERTQFERDGMTLCLRGGHADALGGRGAINGGAAGLPVPRELRAVAPGYYTALSNRPFDGQSERRVLRLYWHVTARGAAPLVRALTNTLNEGHVAFRLKVLNDPTAFTRCDAAVLYVFADEFAGLLPLLHAVYPTMAALLNVPIPALTWELAPGVGLAEEPDTGESFGTHRCGLLAEGLVRAHERGQRRLAQRLRAVGEFFAEHGVSFEAPYLHARSTVRYPIFPPVAAPRRAPASHTRLDAADMTERIGQWLAQTALWHGERCTWLGVDAAEALRTRTLGPELYDGLAGIAVYLAELGHAGGGTTATFSRLARGAMRQALATLDSVRPDARYGCYTGWPGVAVAAARVGMLTGDDELDARAADIIARLDMLPRRRRDPDLLSGLAGAVLASLMARHRASSAMQCAHACAEQLVAQTTRDGEEWWRCGATRAGERPLTGLSHGAAGIGLAFTELFAATSDARWAGAARQAFAWEDQWFSAESHNWPDFRDVCGAASRYWQDTPSRTYWCHGAPGIALSRLRAWQVLGDDLCRERALQALDTTRAATLAELNAQTGNYSLCHGLCGNAEILSLGAETFGAVGASWAAAALNVAQHGAERHSAALSWPLGQRGQTPDLMLGLAGIGRFYLRQHVQALPSLLLPHNWLPASSA
jgi:hypothetical protein